MRDFRDAKAMAQTLRDSLKAKSVTLSHSESLEIVARTLGFHDWNVLAAAIQASEPMLAPARKPSTSSPGNSTLLPVAPMRDVVFFPQTISPIWVGREKTRRAIEAAIAAGGRLFVVTQKRMDEDDPDFNALYSVGVTADILHHMTMPNGTLRVKVSCAERAIIVKPASREYLAAEIEPIQETHEFDTAAFARSAPSSMHTKLIPARHRLMHYTATPENPASSPTSWFTSWRWVSRRPSKSWRPTTSSQGLNQFLAGSRTDRPQLKAVRTTAPESRCRPLSACRNRPNFSAAGIWP
jgi:uncharacterized protein